MAMIWKVLTRKKVIDPVSAEETQLSRVLNTFDLTALGVGSTLGVGVYVLVGHVARDIAGPSVVLSFLLAAIASVFAGLCYAEFGARAPRAGSAYIYSYVCVGEFIAFIIGWNLILEYVIGSASVARGLSLYLDTLINNTLQHAFREVAPIDLPYLSSYFDFFAFGISILLATALAFGLKESSMANNIFTIINILVVGFVVIAGSINANPANWSINPNQNGTNSTVIGNGGFFPFGIEGMIKGAATCFYGFVGFDCIATTGEEVKNPKRAIPVSIILSLLIIFLAYFGTSTVVTLMVPYYLQNPDAPIPYAFEHIGWEAARWIVSIGGIFGLCASLFGAMFPLPRIIYAMANDSLVFKILGRVNSRFQTPVIGTLLAGLLTGLMAAMFDLAQLVNMMSIGTLMAYTIVAASVLLLRYARDEVPQYAPVKTTSDSDDSETYTENQTYNNSDEEATTSEVQDLLKDSGGSVIGQIFNYRRHKTPTKMSEWVVTVEVFLYCIICILIGLSAIYLKDHISNGEIWAIVLTSIVVFLAALIIMSMVTQPTSHKELSFKVPLVPLIPALSILVNIYLMLMLDTHTWIRFAVWMVIGLPIYYLSVRPYMEAQNKNVSNKNSIDNITMVNSKQNGKMNGYTNKAFVSDETLKSQLEPENENKGTKKKPAPQPPIQSNGISDNDIPPEITRLDEILEEAASSLERNSVERKLSVDTVSNVSDFVSREENVVAVVHCDNVVTPTNSNAPSFSFEPKDSVSENNDQSSITGDKTEEPVVINNEPLDVVEKIETQKKTAPSEDIEILTEAEVLEESKIPPAPKPPENFEKSFMSPKNEPEKPDVTLIITPPPSPKPPNEPERHVSSIPTPPPSPLNSPVFTEIEPKGQVHAPPPPVSSQTLPDPIKIVRPTSSNLRNVTLRPIKPREKPKTEEQYEPSDDNLKPGTEKYKKFLESLKGKLQATEIKPLYLPLKSKSPKIVDSIPDVPKEESKSNENVIQDSINTTEASQRLSSFIADPSRNKGILGNINSINDQIIENETQPNEDDAKSSDETNSNNIDDDKISNSTNESSKDDLIEHKNRMQNVFRSINLKKIDSFKDPDDKENRVARTLGPSFLADDKSEHKQAMSEIFKSINQLRKDSQKQIEND